MDFLAVYHDHFSKVGRRKGDTNINALPTTMCTTNTNVQRYSLDCGEAGSLRQRLLTRVALRGVPLAPALRLPGGHLPLLHRVRVPAEAGDRGRRTGRGGGAQAKVVGGKRLLGENAIL